MVNASPIRIRQIFSRIGRKLTDLFVWKIQKETEGQQAGLTHKDALYVSDSEGGFLITATALTREKHNRSWTQRKTASQIIRSDRRYRMPDLGWDYTE